VHHGGGRAGSAAATRDVPLALYYAAPRYHTGIDKVIKQGEVPAILQVGERVETAAQANSTDRMIAAYQQLQARPLVNVLPSQVAAASGNSTPAVELHFHSGNGVAMRQSESTKSDGGRKVDVFAELLDQVDDAMADRVHSGRSSTADAIAQRHGLGNVVR
jgi:hypothetical protein